MTVSKQAWRYTGSMLLLLALAVRTLQPMGYMPGNLAAGESLLVICPTGLPAGLSEHQHHHQQSPDDADGPADLESSDICPYALFLSPIASGIQPAELVVEALHPDLFLEPLDWVIARSHRTASIRAPPLLT